MKKQNHRMLRVRMSPEGYAQNEQKVQEQQAKCLLAENFIKEEGRLSLDDKLEHLQSRTSLNEIAQCTCMHVFLSFDRQDTLPDDKVTAIARQYMTAAGFEDQPYLVYRHYDAWQPHVHIVSANVLPNGELIGLGPKELFKLYHETQAMEHEYALKHNHAITDEEAKQLKEDHAQRVDYGNVSLKRAISDVLNTVIKQYQYTSLKELNAALRLYNVRADRGKEGSKLYLNNGLVYCALDENGNRVSRGLPASSFHLKPTLSYLEEKFTQNQSLRQNALQRLDTTIKWTLLSKTLDWERFSQDMGQESVSVVLQEGEKGKPTDIYFVDHQEKSVFPGECLSTINSLRALLENPTPQQSIEEEELQEHHRLHLSL